MTKKRKVSLNKQLMLVLMICSLCVILATIINIVNVFKASSRSKGSENSLSSETNRDLKNDQYIIGNNPTDAERKYFNELTESLKGSDNAVKAEALAKAFVSDYFTWTNKDGNYEVGGLQYIFGPKFTAFDDWSRWNYYKELDLYIHQFGRDKLPEVETITVSAETKKEKDFVVETMEDKPSFEAYRVSLEWTYDSKTKVNLNDFPTSGEFIVINNNGRMELAEFYDSYAIQEWDEYVKAHPELFKKDKKD